MTRTILPECQSCVALRGTSRLLAESALYLIDRNAALTAELKAFRSRDRVGAEMLLGLVCPAGGVGSIERLIEKTEREWAPIDGG